jgi:hypothetical protein
MLAVLTMTLSLSAGLIAEEGKAPPDATKPAVTGQAPAQPSATDATGQPVPAAPAKPALSADLQRRADFLRSAAAYWRDNGDENKAKFFEDRAAAIESGEFNDAGAVKQRKPEAGDNAAPAEGKGRANPRALRGDKGKRGKGALGLDVIEQRLSDLNEELTAAQAAGDEARSKELTERIVMLRTVLFQEALIREQANRIGELEKDNKAIKDLLKRLAGIGEGTEEKGK